MRFVPIKTDDQLDLQAMHRIRDRLVSRRTAVINQIRAFLLERGMVFAQKPAKLKAAMVLENADNALTPMMRNLIGILWDEWKTVEQQIDELTDRLEQIAAPSPSETLPQHGSCAGFESAGGEVADHVDHIQPATDFGNQAVDSGLIRNVGRLHAHVN
jgi:transposase